MRRARQEGKIGMEVFISYNNNDYKQAMDVVGFLEQNGRSCWVAPRDVVLSYASDIVDAISKCKIFVVLISEHSLNSVHVLNEIEQAYKYYSEGKLAIIPMFVEDVKLSPALDYYLARIQHIYCSNNFNAGLVELQNKIEHVVVTNKFDNTSNSPVVGITNFAPAISEEEVRLANRYYDVDDLYEKRRLKTEGELLLRFEKKVVDDLLKDGEHLNGLVTACMFAKAVMDKIDLSKFDRLIGLCYNEKAVFEANYDYKTDKIKFFNQDVENEDFEEKLQAYMKEMGIAGFDFVDISMGFLDWKNPFKVIKTIKKYMNKGCRVYVKDVDDGVLMYYPDDGKLFSKFKTFYPLDPLSGFRRSGRRVFSYFKKLHASSIELVHSGIDVTDMTLEEKEKMFFSYFGFIPNDFKIAFNQDPTRKDYKAIIEWCDEYYDTLEEAFMGDSFFFNSGYFIYKIRV